MPRRRSLAARINAEAKALPEAERRQMVADAMLYLNEKAARMLARRLVVQFDEIASAVRDERAGQPGV